MTSLLFLYKLFIFQWFIQHTTYYCTNIVLLFAGQFIYLLCSFGFLIQSRYEIKYYYTRRFFNSTLFCLCSVCCLEIIEQHSHHLTTIIFMFQIFIFTFINSLPFLNVLFKLVISPLSPYKTTEFKLIVNHEGVGLMGFSVATVELQIMLITII